jgi:TolB protein
MTRIRALALIVALLFLSTSIPTSDAYGRVAGRAGVQLLPRTDIPWPAVGPGWILAQWTRRGSVVLVSPGGARYLIASTGRWTLIGWSGDGRLALFSHYGSPFRFRVLDLRTLGVEGEFANLYGESYAAFTSPDGLALDVASPLPGFRATVMRTSYQGAPQIRYRIAYGVAGSTSGSWIFSPDGTQLVLGTSRGLEIVDNDGAAVAALPVRDPDRGCTPLSWWPAPIAILAVCGPNVSLMVLPANGARPHPLAGNVQVPPSGIDAVDVAGATYMTPYYQCGNSYLARLRGSKPIAVHLPGDKGPFPGGDLNFQIVAATDSSIAGLSFRGCVGINRLEWYTPSTHSIRVVLPATGGWGVTAAFGFPSPSYEGLP